MPDTVVTFTVAATGDTAQEDEAFAAVSWVRGVLEVTRLAPGSSNPALRRMGTARLDPLATVDSVLADIRSIPAITSADLAATRGLPPPSSPLP
jgi:hypothetical protein